MSEVMKFEITSDEGVILETEGKYCTQNIRVVPRLEEGVTVTENGTFTPADGCLGFKDITVDIQRPLKPITITQNGTYPIPEDSYGYGEIDVAVNYLPVKIYEKTMTKPTSWETNDVKITSDELLDLIGYQVEEIYFSLRSKFGFTITDLKIGGYVNYITLSVASYCDAGCYTFFAYTESQPLFQLKITIEEAEATV